MECKRFELLVESERIELSFSECRSDRLPLTYDPRTYIYTSSVNILSTIISVNPLILTRQNPSHKRDRFLCSSMFWRTRKYYHMIFSIEYKMNLWMAAFFYF